MASAGNPNSPGGGPFDVHSLFKPATPPPTSKPNPQNYPNSTTSANPNLVSAPFPLPSASYPPPASGSGPYALSPQGAASPPYTNQDFVNVQPLGKLPMGRHLTGDHLVYDIDLNLSGEVQPQLLEGTPITKTEYVSDSGDVVGRQIAVNKTYICYGQLGVIRVININNADLRSILNHLAQRVTDMAFFAEDVHLLASASVDGRVYVWNITEGPAEEDKPQITGKIVIAIQITGEGDSVHPRVCWHRHKQEVLAVGIGRHVLRIDTTKVGRGDNFSAEEPLKFSIDKLIDGVQLVGSHDGEVTDLSMCQWMTTCLVSASVDGTIKIWEDRKPLPTVICPHDSQPVNSVTFLAANERPAHSILITGGPLNREIKIWVSASEEGWLPSSNAESWNCTQVLEFKSSDARPEEAFFNQVVTVSQAGLLLLANAKRNAIYAVHLEYGSNPAATHMDYLSEFTVSLPLLSFTGTCKLLPHVEVEQTVQLYCLQGQAIQQYALDLSRCVPPPIEHAVYEGSDSNMSQGAARTEVLATVELSAGKSTEIPKLSIQSGTENPLPVRYPVSPASAISPRGLTTSNKESKPVNGSDISSVSSLLLASSPRVSRTLSGFRSPSGSFEPGLSANEKSGQNNVDSSVDGPLDPFNIQAAAVSSVDDDSRSDHSQDVILMPVSTPLEFKHPNRLVTNSSSNVTKSDGEARLFQINETGTRADSQPSASKNNEKYFCSQASDLGIKIARECRNTPETCTTQEFGQFDENCSVEKEVDDLSKDAPAIVIESSNLSVAQEHTPSSKEKKQKGKNAQGSSPSSTSPSVFKSTDSMEEPASSGTTGEILAENFDQMQESLNQVVIAQKELQKQIPIVVASAFNVEGKRIAEDLGKEMQKVVKESFDALWARVREDDTNLEKESRGQFQQVIGMVSSSIDLRASIEVTLKKELTNTIILAVKKAISTSITQCFNEGVGDNIFMKMENSVNSNIDATLSKEFQAHFAQGTSVSSLDVLNTGFQKACEAMFEHIDATFQKGMAEYTAAANKQLDASHSPLAMALRDAIKFVSSVTQTLKTKLLKDQREFLALAANTKSANPLISQLSNGPLPEVVVHQYPKEELSWLINERKYEEAFCIALRLSDATIVSWLCSKIDLPEILLLNPLPLSQGVLLSLLAKFSCHISTDMSCKLTWMSEVLSAVNPVEPSIAVHVRPIFEQVYQILNHHRNIPTTSSAELSKIRLIMHVINSMLLSTK